MDIMVSENGSGSVSNGSSCNQFIQPCVSKYKGQCVESTP